MHAAAPCSSAAVHQRSTRFLHHRCQIYILIESQRRYVVRERWCTKTRRRPLPAARWRRVQPLPSRYPEGFIQTYSTVRRQKSVQHTKGDRRIGPPSHLTVHLEGSSADVEHNHLQCWPVMQLQYTVPEHKSCVLWDTSVTPCPPPSLNRIFVATWKVPRVTIARITKNETCLRTRDYPFSHE